MKQASASIPKNESRKTKKQASSRKIEPLFDAAFARIFGKDESKPLTQSLVNSILSHVGIEPVGEIERIEAEHTSVGGSVECKTPRMDVRVVASGRMIDLESQRYPEDVDNRSLFYGAQLVCEGLQRGDTYKELPQVVIITLLDAPSLFPQATSYVHACRMAWDVDNALVPGTDRIAFVVVELSKVRKRYNYLSEEVLSDDLLSWAYLLTKGYVDDAEVERIMSEVPGIEYFAELYGRAVDDPKVKRAFEDAVSAEREYQSRMDYLARLEREATERGEATGFKQGEAKGIEKGIEKGIAEAVDILRESGVDEEIITRVAALTATNESFSE